MSSVSPRLVAAIVATSAVFACSDQNHPTRPGLPANATDLVSATSATPTTSVRWNAIARSLVASHNTNGPMASRAYALVSMAQLAAIEALHGSDDGEPNDDAGSSRPSTRAAIAKASSIVLGQLYQDGATATLLATQLAQDETPATDDKHNVDIAAGDALGNAAGLTVIAHAATDGAAAANCPPTPPLPASQFWHDDAVPPNPQPLLPCFGNVRPWLGFDVAQFRTSPAPPPAFGSPDFLNGLAEVRQISDTRTAEQLAIVDQWLDGNNSQQPPGHWNTIASDLITRYHFTESRAAHVLATLNVAMMDTHVACWDRKYTYWETRPWMADPGITTPRGQPHHPANPSGHACAGGAGSGALAGFFPAERDSLFAMGDQEGFSTVLSGVHFPFDVDAGLAIGRAIASQALRLHSRDELLALLTSP